MASPKFHEGQTVTVNKRTCWYNGREALVRRATPYNSHLVVYTVGVPTGNGGEITFALTEDELLPSANVQVIAA